MPIFSTKIGERLFAVPFLNFAAMGNMTMDKKVSVIAREIAYSFR